jgi:ubiquinone/menaquinone biosynthesis C-methylase UbiE
VLDPAIESHYQTGHERSRLFPGGTPSLEFVRSMELLERLLPPLPARLLDVGGGPGAYAAPLARRGYTVHLIDPLPLHVEQACQAADSGPAAFTAALGDARKLSEPAVSQDAVLLFGPLYHLTEAAQRRQALTEAWRVLRPGGRLLAMAVCRFAALLNGVYEDWLDGAVALLQIERAGTGSWAGCCRRQRHRASSANATRTRSCIGTSAVIA